MKPINLFNVANVFNNFKNDFEIVNKYINHHSSENKIIKKTDIDCLAALVNKMLEYSTNVNAFDFFYISFEIPQISKEFDLLKIDEKYVLNIELKVTMTNRVESQLKQNKYYLSYLARPILLYTYIKDSNKLFKLDDSDKIVECEIKELITIIAQLNNPLQENINDLFKVSNYLVSPLNTPVKFIQRQYFLTNPQEMIKKKIFISFKSTDKFIVINSNAGTGKTLLIYDIALDLSKNDRVCIIHCGIMCNGHTFLQDNLVNIDIFSAKQIHTINFENYDYIIVDEAHRFYRNQFDDLIEIVNQRDLRCIFSLDYRQILSKSEKKYNIYKCLDELEGKQVFELKGKVRVNKEVAAFILALFDNSKKNFTYKYENIEIIYCDNYKQAAIIISDYENKGYTFIKYTGSRYKHSSFDYLRSDYNSHNVIGQEFDNVIVYMDNYFSYVDDQLKASDGPNPDYYIRQLLYQNLTRCRERLCIIIIGNRDLLGRILNILHNNSDCQQLFDTTT